MIEHRRVQLDWPKDREFRILSIDGGGIRGIFPATFLAGLEERYLGGSSVARYFDLITGTSTGGIIALGLGAGIKASKIQDLYVNQGRKIFPPMNLIESFLKSCSIYFKYRYSRDALMNILEEFLGDRTLNDSQTRLCIPSCDGRYGDVYVFKTPHHQDFRKDGEEKMTKVATATSAAPTFFKPMDDGPFTFIDGGIWANNPIMIGLSDALSCFSVPRENIRILSLGCGSAAYTVTKSQRICGGLFQWRKIIYAAMHLQSLSAWGQAGLLIGRHNIIRVDAPMLDKQIELDDWLRASKELPTAAMNALDRCGGSVASVFLKDPVDEYLPYLHN